MNQVIPFNDIIKSFGDKIIIPTEFEEFYNWYSIQQNKYPDAEFLYGFHWDNDKFLLHTILGNVQDNHFGVFGSGGSGDLYSFWVDDKGNQKIVYLSSGGGDDFILGNTFLEFLQYLSIGYPLPDTDYFDLTIDQVLEKERADFDSLNAEQFNDELETDIKKLQTEEGIKALYGEDISDEDVKMFAEIMSNADLSNLKIDKETIEKMKTDEIEQEKILKAQISDFKSWLLERFGADSPKKATDILNLDDPSLNDWIDRYSINL